MLIVLVGALGCQTEPPPVVAPAADEVFRDVATPARPGSSVPGLFRIGNRVAMSWVEEADGHAALRFAVREGESWSAPQTVAEGDDWFVNWADRPGVVSLGDSALAAYYLVEHGGDNPYAYDIRLVRSADAGRTWSAPITPHHDGTPTEHGFVGAVPQLDGSLLVAWLDGRGYHPVQQAHDGHDHAPTDEMSLRTATLGPDGQLTDEAQLDHRTCDCCPTAAVAVPGGALVAYRDRSADEIRDIAVVRREGDAWSAPALVHADGWQIDGCPVNGPALDAAGERVALAWFTAADGAARARLAFSDDAGKSWGEPVTVSDEHPVGRVEVVALGDGGALVSWIEQIGDAAELRVRAVAEDGTLGVPITVAGIAAERASGMPRMIRDGEWVLLAWTESGDASQIRVRAARLEDLRPTDAELDRRAGAGA
ncbi:MAG: sialidase family protein [Rhodothermales bacterium]